MHPGHGSPVRDEPAELAIFDIDGPVTAPVSRMIEQAEILDLTIDFITARGYVAYNTGRASAVAHRRVISPLLARAQARGIDPGIVSRRVSVFAEKGAVTSFWDDGLGAWNHRIDPATVVPADLRDEVAGLLLSDAEFRTYIFVDSDKETMVSVEMRHETSERPPVPVTPSVFKPAPLTIDGDFQVKGFPDMYGRGTVAYLRACGLDGEPGADPCKLIADHSSLGPLPWPDG